MILKQHCLTIIAAACALHCAAIAVAGMPADRLLPQTTRSYISFADIAQFSVDAEATRFTALAQDPVMKPFLDAARDSFEKSAVGLRELADVTVDELREASGGEACLAIVESAAGKAALVGIADLAGKKMESDKLIAKIDAGLRQRGAERTTKKVDGTDIHHYRWKSRGGEERQSTYFIKDEMLVLANDMNVASGILPRWKDDAKSLSKLPAYRDVIDRSLAAAGAAKPPAQWYFDPFRYAALFPAPADEKPTALEFAKKHGFDGIKAVGGTLSVATPEFDALAYIAVYAPPEDRRGGLRMVSLVPGAGEAPLPWVLDDVNSYAEVHLNLGDLLDYVGPLFDDIAADGIEGTFNDILADLKSADGPGVDVKEDLLAHLESRIVIVGDHTLPATPSSEQMLLAIKTKNEDATADAVKRLMQDDPAVNRLALPGYKNDMWRFANNDDAALPNYGVIVARGYLLIATNGDLIRKLLLAPAGAAGIAEAADFQLVAKRMADLGAGGASVRAFSRPTRDFYTTYSLIRAGKLDQIESLYATIVARLFGDDKDRVTEFPKLDFSTLPEFEKIEMHLQPVGVFVKVQPTGWLVVGFTLP